MTIDLESLRGHTPGPWKWWTSCSFRRLSAEGDGDVLCAVTHSDGHPDVHLKNGGWEGPDGRLIELAPILLAEYERNLIELTARRARDAEVEALVAALREAMEWNWLDDDARPSKIADQCDKALAPFTGDKT